MPSAPATSAPASSVEPRLNEAASPETVIAAVAGAQAVFVAAAVAEAHNVAEAAEEPVAEKVEAVRLDAEASSAAEPASAESSTDDPFEKAARALGLAPVAESTAEDAAEASSDSDDEPAEPAHVVKARPRLRRLVTVGATVGVMGVAGLLTVAMSLPTGAVAVAQGAHPGASMSLVAASSTDSVKSDASDDEIQAFVAASDVHNETIERADDFDTVSLVEVAAEQGINYSSDVFTNDPEAAIQWPFMVGVGMTWGYGMRDGRMHQGIDFVPGNGAPIQAIADGVVRKATEQGGGYGVTVYIDHVIDGEVITSHYSHMQYGSLRVKTGDKVKVGDIVGLTGNTGHSYGAHLHFELLSNGATFDPMPWLQKNAGRDSLG